MIKPKKHQIIKLTALLMCFAILFYSVVYFLQYNQKTLKLARTLSHSKGVVLYSSLILTKDSVYDRIGKLYTGKAIQLNSNGKLIAIKSYKKGKKDGQFFNLYDNGENQSQREYSNGTPHGTWYYAFPNGKIMLVKEFDKGKLTELWQKNENETMKYSVKYKNGKLLYERFYDKNGKLLKEKQSSTNQTDKKSLSNPR